MTLRQDFYENVTRNKTWNRVIEWNGLRLATVQWHNDREWKLLENGEDFDTIKERSYRCSKEFHTQNELWDYVKQLVK